MRFLAGCTHRGARASGFTLVELMAVVAAAAVLLALALPTWAEMIGRHRVAAEVNLLSGDLALARTTAIGMRKRVVLCPTVSGKACDGNWSEGRMIFVDLNGNNVLDEDEPVARSTGEKPHFVRVTGSGFVDDSVVVYRFDGTVLQSGTVTLCGGELAGRTILVAQTGRNVLGDAVCS